MDTHVVTLQDLRSHRRSAPVPPQSRSIRRYADRIGITAAYLSQIERGLTGGVDVRIALAIERVYGVQVDWEAALPPLKAA